MGSKDFIYFHAETLYVEGNFNKQKLEVQESRWEYFHLSFLVGACIYLVIDYWLFPFHCATKGLPKGSYVCLWSRFHKTECGPSTTSRSPWLERAHDAAFASGEAAPSICPRLKRRISSKTEGNENPTVTKEIPEGPDNVVLDEEEIKDDVEMIFLQRRRRTPIVHLEDVDRLFRESRMAKIDDYPFRSPIVLTGQKGTASSTAPVFTLPSTSTPPPIITTRDQDGRSPDFLIIRS